MHLPRGFPRLLRTTVLRRGATESRSTCASGSRPPSASPLGRRVGGFIAFAVALGAAGMLALPAVAFAWDANTFNASAEQELYTLTNQARASAGLPSLRINSTIASLARWRSQDMADRGYFSHTIPPSGEMVWDVMDQRGICYNLVGENIGWNNYPDDESPAQIQASFMGSPEHRSNIVGRAWDEIGIGAYKGGDGHILYTVLFVDTTGCGTTSTPTPTPKPTPKPTPRPTPAPTATPQPTLKPTAAPTATPQATPKPTPTPTPAPVVTPRPTPLPTAQPTVAPTPRPTPRPTARPTPSPTPAPTPTPTPAPTPSPSPEATPPLAPTPTPEPTPSPTPTISPTPEPTLTPAPTPTETPTPTDSPSASPFDSASPLVADQLGVGQTASPPPTPPSDDLRVPDGRSLRVIDQPSSPGLLESILGGVMQFVGF
jgi:uncharacterized protein YkwD